jgi:hypothetical protein
VPAFAATYLGLTRTFGIPELDPLLARILPRRLSGRANQADGPSMKYGLFIVPTGYGASS